MAYRLVAHEACAACGQPFVAVATQKFCDKTCWKTEMSETFRTNKRPGVLKVWTEPDLLVALERAQSGVPVRQIADEADINQGALGRLLKRRFGYRPTPYRRPTLFLPDDPATLAYIAGIIDGEGSICYLNKHWCVKVGMTHEGVIRWLHSFGGSFEKPKLYPSRKQSYTWLVHRHHDVITLLTAILPYLRVKPDHARDVLATFS